MLLEVNCAIDYVSNFGSSTHWPRTAAAKLCHKIAQVPSDNGANSSVELTIVELLVEAVDNNQLKHCVLGDVSERELRNICAIYRVS